MVEPGAGTGLLQTFLPDTELASHMFFQKLGYSPARYAFRMRRDLTMPIPELPIPPGLELRPARPEHFRAIWEAEREAFQDHWGYAPWPDEAYQRFLQFPHYDPRLWQVAWDGDQVAGSVLNYINAEENASFARLRGYTEDISVRRPWRRRGLASALIARSLAAVRECGMTEAVLGVDAENRTCALRVYERLGYTTIQQWTVYHGRNRAVRSAAIGAVVWDAGGVLVRTIDQAPRRAWEARLGLELGGLERLVFRNEVAQQAAVGRG
jgi:ribosomal protein S18 acetylase RimI-like enzyme